jgi:hypothetical protein
MEITVLKATITQITRLHQILDLYINDYGHLSDNHEREARSLIEMMEGRAAELAGEVTANCVAYPDSMQGYFKQLSALADTQQQHAAKFYEDPYEEVNKDPDFEYFMQWYSNVSALFIENLFAFVGPIQRRWYEERNKELTAPTELIYSLNDNKAARLIYFKFSGLLDALKNNQEKQLGYVNKSALAKVMGPILDISPEYIESLLGSLDNFNSKQRKNSPYTLNAVNKALRSLSEVDIEAPELVKIHEQLSSMERRPRSQKK